MSKLNKDQIIYLLVGVILFMFGYIVGSWQGKGPSFGRSANESNRSLRDGLPEALPRPQAGRGNQTFVSEQLDANRNAWSAQIQKRSGGNFVLEKCPAPDFKIAQTRGGPLRKPCEKVFRGKIENVDEGTIKVTDQSDGKNYTLGFEGEGDAQRLKLESLPGVAQKQFLKIGSGISLHQLFESDPQIQKDKEAFMQYQKGRGNVPAARPPTPPGIPNRLPPNKNINAQKVRP